MRARPTFEDDDLLKPTLEKDLDVRRFESLFRPQSILWPTFFGGPVAAGILFGINYRRMGLRRAQTACWIGSAVMMIGLTIAVLILVEKGLLEQNLTGAARNIRLPLVAVSVAVGWFVARHQERRYTAYVSAGREPRPLLVPGLLAWLAGIASIALCVALVFYFFRPDA